MQGVGGSSPPISTIKMQFLVYQGVAFCFLASYIAATSFATIFNLRPLDKYENIKPFKGARLYDAGGDLIKRWFVEFYVWDTRKGRRVRKRYYQINQYETVEERRADPEMQEMLEELIEKEKTIGLNEDEKEELDHYIVLERLIRLAKARALYRLGQ